MTSFPDVSLAATPARATNLITLWDLRLLSCLPLFQGPLQTQRSAVADRFLKLIGQVQKLLFWPPSRVPRRYGPLGHTQPGVWYFTTPSNLFICRSTTFFAPPTSERPSSRQLVQEFAGTLKIQPAPIFDSILWWRLMDWKSVRV